MKYAILGVGLRHQMYRDALVGTPIGKGDELVALCDSDPLRLKWARAAARPVELFGTVEDPGNELLDACATRACGHCARNRLHFRQRIGHGNRIAAMP